MSEQDWAQVVEQIKGMGYAIEQVREWIHKEKGVVYTYKMVWYKLRKHYKLPYGKAYMENKKMPADAKERIEKNRAFLELYPQAMLGFVDGSCLQNRPNAARMLATPVWVYQQEGKRTQPFFGFMSLQGRPCIQAVDKADAWALEAFLCLIRKENNDGRPMNLK